MLLTAIGSPYSPQIFADGGNIHFVDEVPMFEYAKTLIKKGKKC